MLVDRLTFVVVVGMELAIRSGDRLRGFVSLESQVQRTLALRELGPARSLITEHQVVMRLQILGIDLEDAGELRDRLGEFALQEQHASELIADDAIARIQRRGGREMLPRL